MIVNHYAVPNPLGRRIDLLKHDLSTEPLAWQSRWLLAAVLLPAAAWIAVQSWMAALVHPPTLWQALLISGCFAVLVRAMRAATTAAALTGAVLTACIYYQAPGMRTALWPMLAMLVLTLGATRAGRRHKEALGTAESRRGRGPAQVAANLGMAALASFPTLFGWSRTVSLMVLTAALAEAAADTLSSELGQVFGGTPRLVTTGRRVTPGTDGAVSLAGTLVGIAGALVIAAIGGAVLGLGWSRSAVAFFAAVAGLFADSLLGATLERGAWLNNDAVNFLSTAVAGLVAVCFRSR